MVFKFKGLNTNTMIKRKKKICASCGQPRYIYALRMCEFCYRKNRVLAGRSAYARKAVSKEPNRSVKPPKSKSGYIIPFRTKKPTITYKWLQSHWGFSSQVDLFKQVWDNHPAVCRFTGERLNKYRGTKMENNCCLHLLPKGKYPLFKLNPDNVVLGLPEFHRIVDQGTIDERKEHPDWNFDLWDRMVEDKKKEYINFKEEHLL